MFYGIRPVPTSSDPLVLFTGMDVGSDTRGGAHHVGHHSRRPGPDIVDRGQGIHDQGARGVRAAGRRAGRQGDLLPGAVLRPLLLPGAGPAVLLLRRVDPRADHRAVPGARRRAGHGDGPADVRAGAARGPLQHRGRGRRRRQLPRQVPQDAHPAGEGLLGEVLLPARATSATRSSTPPSGRIGVYICYDRHFPEGWRALGLAGAQIVFNPSATTAACRPTCGSSSSPPRRWPTSTSSARSTGSASRTSATNDFYGTSYFVDPEGKFVGEPGDAHQPELHRPRPGPGPAGRGPRPLGRSTATAARTPTVR